MSDAVLNTPVTGLFQGVSRQAPVMRSANQLDELENAYPSVDLSGSVRRPGTTLAIGPLTRSSYADGQHHFFRTTDGQAWVLLRRALSGLIEIRNLSTGVLATVTSETQAENYLNQGTRSLRFLQIADTTLIANTSVVVGSTVAAVPALSEVFLWVRRVSSVKQEFIVTRSGGSQFAQVSLAKDNEATRESVVQSLLSALTANFGGLGLTFALAGQNGAMIRATGPANLLAELDLRCTWDQGAALTIKGRVASATDLPASINNGTVLMVDLKQGDPSAAYYVRFDAASGSWIETSYLPGAQATASLNAWTMPVRLRQTGPNAFSMELCPWTARTLGDNNTNPLPFFAGKRISDIASWKGRLVLACEDTLSFSQADDYFHFFKETARESRPADAFDLPCDSDAVSVVRHVVPFRNTLFVAADNVQLEVPGDRALTPESATIAPTTSYNLSGACRPSVIGDSLYFAGITDGRGAVWQYFYDDTQSSNTAFDLSKHVPGYVQGTVRKIVGSPTAGRMFLLAARAPNVVYTHTQYWSGQERVQNAWNRGIVLDGSAVIEDLAVVEDTLYLIVTYGTALVVLRVPVDNQAADRSPMQMPYLDQLRQALPTYNAGNNQTEVSVPASMMGQQIVLVGYAAGEDWWREFTGTVSGGFLRIAGNVTGLSEYWLGVRYRTVLRFSPFYMNDGERNLTTGTLQVRRVVLAANVTGDFTATVSRPDRAAPTQVQRTARTVGGQWVRPTLARNTTVAVPFNSKGDAASLTIEMDSSAPWTLTGYTLMGRYSNPFA